jgi:hypothetical protein
MKFKNILFILPLTAISGAAFAAKPLPYKISFFYDTRDSGTSYEGDCMRGLYDVSEPGIGLAKRLSSDCQVKDRALTDAAPVYKDEAFEADYDIQYIWPCAGQELGIGVSAEGKGRGVQQLRIQGVNRRVDFYANELSAKPQFVTVTGRSNLTMFDNNPRNKTRILAECALTIQSIKVNPSFNTLEKWVVQAEGTTMLLRADIDAYRLAGAFVRLADKPKELLQDQLSKIDRLITLLNDPADPKKRLAVAEANKVKLAIQQAIDAPSGQIPDFGGAQKSADQVMQYFKEKLQADIASAVAQLERFAAFSEASDMGVRPVDSMDMDAIRDNMNASTTLDMSVDSPASVLTQLNDRKRSAVDNLKVLINDGKGALGESPVDPMDPMPNPNPTPKPDPCDSMDDMDMGAGSSSCAPKFEIDEMLKNGFQTSGSATLTPELEAKLLTKAIEVTQTCKWASRPYAYQFKDGMIFVNKERNSYNAFDFKRVTDAGCRVLDVNDDMGLNEYMSRYRSFSELGFVVDGKNHSLDSSVMNALSNHSRRLSLNCAWASRPNIFQFKDSFVFVDKDYTNYNVFDNATVAGKSCAFQELK